eukprot:4228151-Ditylum_brightwellii.AAC.1
MQTLLVFVVVEDQQDVTSVRSRTEYVALSQLLRDLLPTKELITEVVKGMWKKDKHKALKFVSKSTVNEDNNSSYPKMAPT